MSGYPMRITELLAGENQGADRLLIAEMCLDSAVKTADALIYTGPCILFGYHVHVAVAVAGVTIEDGLTAGAGATKVTIPVSKAIGEYPCAARIYCAAGIYLNYAATATGSINVLYLPIL